MLRKLRSNREPLYLQVKKQLEALVSERRSSDGALLPSENVIARKLGVSRSTVREAVRMLEEERAVVRRRGVGTFILGAGPRMESGIEELTSITEIISKLGRKPGTVDVEVTVEQPEDDVRDKLGLGKDDNGIVVRRVRTADGERVVYSHDVIPEGIMPKGAVTSLKRCDLDGGLFRFLESRCNLEVAYAVSGILATKADGMLAERLQAPVGEPLLLLSQVHYDANGRPILFSRDYFRTEKFTFCVIRKRYRVSPGRHSRARSRGDGLD